METIRRFIDKYGVLGIILATAVVMFVTQILVFGMANENGYKSFYEALALPNHILAFFKKPWTILTYWTLVPFTFLFTLIFELLILYTFGRIYQSLVGEEKFKRLIIFSVLANGFLLVLLGTLIYSPDKQLYYSGLHTIMLTVIAATITLVPEYPVRLFLFGQVKIMWVGLFIILLETAMYQFVFTFTGLAAVISSVAGFAVVRLLQNGTDITSWSGGRSRRRPAPSRQYVRKGEPSISRKSPLRPGRPGKAAPVSPEEELNLLLDKINEVGYENLSRKEKERLDDLSGR